MTKALRDKSSPELTEDVRDAMREIVGDLLSAAKVAHGVDRIEEMNLKFVQALGNDFDTLGNYIRDVSTNLRKATAAYELLVERSKQAKLAGK